jgi:type I restriction enzyme S subunit
MNLSTVWKEERAKEYCSSVRDGTHDSPKFVDHGYPLITSKAIKDGALLFESAGFISEKDFNEINKRSKVDQWDILFTMIGTLGEVYLEKGNQINYAIKNVGLFKCEDEIKAKWLYLWFRNQTTRQAILQLRRGASQQYLPLGTLRDLKIKYPSDWEYGKKIIDLIYRYDDLIENNKRRIELLEESARQLYKEWFVRFRFPGHEHVKIIDGVPAGWQRLTVAECCEKPTYGFTASADTEPVGPKLLRITDIVPSSIDWPSVPYCLADEDTTKKYRLVKGDIVVARTGATVG